MHACIRKHTYMHTYINTYLYIHACMHAYENIHACMHAYIRIYIRDEQNPLMSNTPLQNLAGLPVSLSHLCHYSCPIFVSVPCLSVPWLCLLFLPCTGPCVGRFVYLPLSVCLSVYQLAQAKCPHACPSGDAVLCCRGGARTLVFLARFSVFSPV